MARIAVVDDSAPLRMLFARVLELEGHVVDVHANGASALENLLADPPDLLICDLNLPGMSGLEIVARLRQHPPTRMLPCIAVTGDVGTGNHHAAPPAGFDRVLGKPVDNAVLTRHVATLLARSGDAVASRDDPEDAGAS